MRGIEDIINEIVKKRDLDAFERHMLLHDINNGRGDEWLLDVELTGDAELFRQYKEYINYKEEE